MRKLRPSWLLLAAPAVLVLVVVVAVIFSGFWLASTGAGSQAATGSDEPREEPDAEPPAEDRTVIAYVPYWDQERAFDSVLENIEIIDEVSPFWYAPDAEGNVELSDPQHTTVDRMMVRYLQEQGIRVIPTITNLRSGDWDPEVVGEVLADDARMEAHVRNIVDLVIAEGYDGIDLDYESLRARDRDPYSAFLRELSAALHAEDKLLTSSVHPKTSDEGVDERNVAQDFEVIGETNDQVRVMTYDYSWDTSPPGPVAPAEWVEEVIAWTVTQIPREKVVLGVVLLGYDWVDGHGETVDYYMAMSRARQEGAEIQRADDESPWYTYTDQSSREHEVWFEDAASISSKLRLIREYDLGGVFAWRLGGEDPGVWSEVPKYTGALGQ